MTASEHPVPHPEDETSDDLGTILGIYKRIARSLSLQGQEIQARLAHLVSTRQLDPRSPGAESLRAQIGELSARLDRFSQRVASDFPEMTTEEAERAILKFLMEHPDADVEYILDVYNPATAVKDRIRMKMREMGRLA